jgi:hypothetical protein
MLGMMTVMALMFSAVAIPAPTAVAVEVVTVNGSGCQVGTTAVAMNSDNTAFTVRYSGFQARAGVGTSPTEFRKNCQINLKLRYPQDVTFGIAQVDYRGSARLPVGATGVERGNHYFAGSPSTLQQNHSFAGPLTDNWQATDTTDPNLVFFPPCGQNWNLNANTEIRVTAGAAGDLSAMTMSPTTGDFSATYHLTWRKCG